MRVRLKVMILKVLSNLDDSMIAVSFYSPPRLHLVPIGNVCT